MVLPKKKLKRKPSIKERVEVSKEFHYSLQKVLEENKGCIELLPALDYLSKITRIPISDLAKENAMERSIGEIEAMKILGDVERTIDKAGVSKAETGMIRSRLEEKVRGIHKFKKPFGTRKFKVKWNEEF